MPEKIALSNMPACPVCGLKPRLSISMTSCVAAHSCVCGVKVSTVEQPYENREQIALDWFAWCEYLKEKNITGNMK